MFKNFYISKVVLLAISFMFVNCADKKTKKTDIEQSEVKTLEEKLTSKIVYVSHLEDDLEIFVMDVNGNNAIQLTNNTAEDMYPSWSHNGTKIAFLSDRNGEMGIYIMNADGSEQKLIKANTFAIPAWSNNDKKLLITEDIENGRLLKTVNIENGIETLIITGSKSDGYGKWASTGTYIVFESNRDGDSEIYSVNTADSSHLKRLTENPNLDEWPSWSKDSKQIAYTSGVEGNKDIWIMNADGTNKQKVTEDITIGDSFPSWSPDNKRIIFATFTDNVAPEIYVIDIEQKSITKLGNGSGPDWSPF